MISDTRPDATGGIISWPYFAKFLISLSGYVLNRLPYYLPLPMYLLLHLECSEGYRFDVTILKKISAFLCHQIVEMSAS